MSDRDIDELFRKFKELDVELKELRREVSEIKWYTQHGTSGAVAYSAAPPGHGQAYVGVIDSVKFDEEFK